MFAKCPHEKQNLHEKSDRSIRLCIPQRSRGNACVHHEGDRSQAKVHYVCMNKGSSCMRDGKVGRSWEKEGVYIPREAADPADL